MADMPAPIEALSGLRTIAPATEPAIAALCRLLAAQDVIVSTLDVEPDGHWFAAEAVSFRLERAGHEAITLTPERIEDAAAALDMFEPALRAIEAALGISLEPAALGPLDNGATLRLGLAHDGHRLALAWRSGIEGSISEDWTARARALPLHGADIPCPYTVTLAGPRLTIGEASDLEGGDLVLLGTLVAARLVPLDGPPIAGRLLLAEGRFTAEEEGRSMPEAAATADFAVPLQICLPERMTSAATLAALVPGATLPIGPVTDGMPVELIVGGRRLARGELVKIGDGFAVLIEERPQIADRVQSEDVRPERAEAAA